MATVKISELDASSAILEGADLFELVQGGTNKKATLTKLFTDIKIPVSLLQPAIATGVPQAFGVTGGALTNLTLSTEVSDVVLDLSHTVQWATGALATQRAMRLLAPTYAFVGASVITKAVTLSLSGAPIAGTNATLTTSVALEVESGQSLFPVETTAKPAIAFNTVAGHGINAPSSLATDFIHAGVIRLTIFNNGLRVQPLALSDTVPFLYLAGDLDTGVGHPAADEVSLIAGAVQALKCDKSVTATHTRFLIYDVDNATLERVTVGAADSGGTNFKLLRIPN